MPYGTLKVDNIIFTNDGVDQTITVSGIVASTSGNLTATGTISGNIIRGGTTVSGATVTGSAGQFGNLTAVSGTFTTQFSGVTVTGTTANFTSGNFTSISGGTHTITSGVFAAGTATNPSISFASDPNTGIYRPTVDEIGFTTNGQVKFVIDIDGQLEAGAIGSESIPTYTFSSDSDTGIYSPGANQLAISTNGTGRLFVDSSGNVGIGGSPQSDVSYGGFTVNGSNGSIITLRAGGSNSGRIYTTGTDNLNIDGNGSASTNILFRTGTGSTERMRLDSSGRLGLGTSTPGAIFHSVNTSAGAATVGAFIQNSSLTAGTEVRLGFAPNTNLVSDNRYSWIGAVNVAGSNDSALTFATTPGGQGATERMRITGAGLVGIGTTSPGDQGGQKLTVSDGSIAISNGTANGANGELRFIGRPDGVNYNWAGIRAISDVNINQGTLAFFTSASNVSAESSTERARIDSSGRLLVGTSTARTTSTVNWLSQIEGGFLTGLGITSNSNDTGGAYLSLAKSRGASVGSNTIVQNGDGLGYILFSGADGTDANTQAAFIGCEVDGIPGANDMPGRLVFSTTADGASSPTERMRITSADSTSADGTLLFYVGANGYQATDGRHGLATYKTQNNATANAANSVVKIGQMQTTGRSINAAGTVNASGADYAEYMIKAGDFEIAKGDVCGVTSNGKLTNVFADAIGFVVKSTNPSYVGGDTWGTEDSIGSKPGEDEPELLAEWEATLEAERQKVDRIAFAGQVPVNVTGATPGQYIVPVASEDGGITGIAKDEADLTLAEYMRAVGKVIAIEDDGRARIIVKVA